MEKILAAVLITFLILVIIILETLKATGKLHTRAPYSYRSWVKCYIKLLLVTIIGCLLLYLFTKSTEVAITIGVILISCMAMSFILMMYSEYSVRRYHKKKKKQNNLLH